MLSLTSSFSLFFLIVFNKISNERVTFCYVFRTLKILHINSSLRLKRYASRYQYQTVWTHSGCFLFVGSVWGAVEGGRRAEQTGFDPFFMEESSACVHFSRQNPPHSRTAVRAELSSAIHGWRKLKSCYFIVKRGWCKHKKRRNSLTFTLVFDSLNNLYICRYFQRETTELAHFKTGN